MTKTATDFDETTPLTAEALEAMTLTDLAFARQQDVLAAFNDLPETEAYSVVGDAQLVELVYGERLRYVPAWKAWRVYTGGKWDGESSAEYAEQAAEAVLRVLAHHAADLLRTDEGKRLSSHVARSFDKVSGIVDAARRRPTLMAHPRAFDTFLDYLNVRNGVIDLVSGRLYQHKPSWLMTKQAPVDYEPRWLERVREHPDTAQAVWQEACPTWLRFLDDVFQGDTALVAWLQRLLGYCLTGRTDEQVMFLPFGRGRNGKSTLNNLLARILGDYAATIKPETLVRQNGAGFRNESSHDPELVKLVGVRVAVSSEPPNTATNKQAASSAGVMDDARVKLITGGEPISVRPPYGQSFQYTPQFKLMMAVNELPERREHTEGAERRVLSIPFNARFVPGQNCDPRMEDKLWAEREGILAWLVAGAVQWYATRTERPLTVDEPQVVAELNEDYKREQDVYRAFFLDMLTRDEQANLGLSDAFTVFMRWRTEKSDELLDALGVPYDRMGYRALPKVTLKQFGTMAEVRGFTKRRLKSGMALTGVRLASSGDRAQSGAASTSADQGEGDEGPEPGAVVGVAGVGNEANSVTFPKQRSREKVTLNALFPTPPTPMMTTATAEPVTEPPPAPTEAAAGPEQAVGEPSKPPRKPLSCVVPPAQSRCPHCGGWTYIDLLQRQVRCNACKTSLGPAQPDPHGCRHALAEPHPASEGLDISLGDDDGDDVRPAVVLHLMRCEACEMWDTAGQRDGDGHFRCAEPDEHRANWDNLGCPICAAAWQQTHQQQMANDDAYVLDYDKRKAEDARREADYQAYMAQVRAKIDEDTRRRNAAAGR